jgi:hypothetical protein
MTHSGRSILAAVVLLVTFGVTSASGQNSLKYSLSDHMQIGPITQALYSPTPAHLLIQTGVIELNKQSSRIDSTRGFDGTIITSALGGVVGGVAGIAAALAIVPLSGAEGWDQLGVFGLGFLVFEPLGIGIGAHLGNGARGNLGAAIGSSYGMLLLGGLASMAITSVTEVPIGIIIPILQVGGAVYAERNTTK